MGNIVVHDVKVKWLVDVIALLMACCVFFSFPANNHFIKKKKRTIKIDEGSVEINC